LGPVRGHRRHPGSPGKWRRQRQPNSDEDDPDDHEQGGATHAAGILPNGAAADAGRGLAALELGRPTGGCDHRGRPGLRQRHPAQCRAKGRCTRESVFRREGHGARQHSFEFGRSAPGVCPQQRGRPGEPLPGDGCRAGSGKRQSPGDHLVDRQSKCVDIGAGVGLRALDELGRQVGNCAQQVLGLARGERPVDGFGDSEVGNFCHAGLIDDDVFGLDVAVHDALLVGVLKGRCHLGAVPYCLGLGHPALGFEQVSQGVPVTYSMAMKRRPSWVPGIEDADDVRVLQAGDDPGLALEGGNGVAAGGGTERFVQEFECDPAPRRWSSASQTSAMPPVPSNRSRRYRPSMTSVAFTGS